MTYEHVPTGNEDLYEVFRPLMIAFGATCSPKEFHWAVNDALHAAEATTYDNRHAAMYLEAGGAVWERLFSYLPDKPEKLLFLDVGCGTGLVGHFASLYVPRRVEMMVLADPSAKMLDIAREKAAHWPFKTNILHCTIDALDITQQYDVVTINSVLHHIVELESFVKRVQTLIKPGGVLLTAQDPRAVATTRSDVVLAARRQKDAIPFWDLKKRINASRVVGKYWRRITRRIRGALHLQSPLTTVAIEASSTLLAKGIIKRPMDETSLYFVTDVHVPRKLSDGGDGIDEGVVQKWMPDMELVAVHSYRFHDADFNRLSTVQQECELAWWRANDPHGATMALAFRHRH